MQAVLSTAVGGHTDGLSSTREMSLLPRILIIKL
jgi:hypothetical protein